MSGPKISVYSLTGRARAVVFGQMRCEQQSLVCADQIRTMLSEMSGSKQAIEKSLAMLALLQKRGISEEQTIADVKALQSRVDQDLKSIEREFRSNIPRVSTKYQISEEALAAKQADLARIQVIRDRLKKLQEEVNRAINAGKEAGAGEQKKVQQTIADYLSDGAGDAPAGISARDMERLKESIGDDLGGIISFEFDASEPAADTSFQDRKNAVQKELADMLKQDLSPELTEEVKTAVRNLEKISQMSYLTSFESVTVKRLHRSIEAYRRECIEKQAEMAELYARYQTLCEMAAKPEEKDRIFAEKEELEVAIAELEAALIKQQEQSYISDCVDEVMADMGYDLIGHREVRKRSGKRFKNELYQFGEGTAVNVTYSPEGQISMELGGIAREDRIPSEEETSVLTQDMETFCSEFAEFERKMKERGVIVGNRVAMMPPTAEYAAIINVSDYEIEAGKQIAEINVSTKRKKTAAEKKVLRRDE